MPARSTSSPGIPVTKKANARPLELAFAFSNRENQVYSERSCLNAWLIQYPLLSAGASGVRFSGYPQCTLSTNIRKTGREGSFIEQAPISSRFYEYLFRDCCDYRHGKSIDRMNQQKRRKCVSYASRQERSEKHLFWMLGERKWEFQ